MLDTVVIKRFRREVQAFYMAHGRHDLPWRQAEADGSYDPYKILVSELMLQQTQVARVIPKFSDFLGHFPTIDSLAKAPIGDVLRVWSGLGYNRRAKFLHQAAMMIQAKGGAFPKQVAELQALPGVGYNTAGAITVYAFNQSAVFIETNVRTVFIHHFFTDQVAVSDTAIRAMVAATLPSSDWRLWYSSLMDYGSYLKQTIGNPNQASGSYSKQSAFNGSRRQIRGQIIKLLSLKARSRIELEAAIVDERLLSVVDALLAEGLIREIGRRLSL